MRRGPVLLALGGGLLAIGIGISVLTLLGFVEQLERSDAETRLEMVSESLTIEPSEEAHTEWKVADLASPFYITITSTMPVQAIVLDPEEGQISSLDIARYNEFEIVPTIAGNYSLVLRNNGSEAADAQIMVASFSIGAMLMPIAGVFLSLLVGFGTIIAGIVYSIRDRKRKNNVTEVPLTEASSRPGGVAIIGILTIISGAIAIVTGVSGILSIEVVPNYSGEGEEGHSVISSIWEIGGAVAMFTIGGATIRGKGWAWKSNVVSSIHLLVLPSIVLAASFFLVSEGQSPFVLQLAAFSFAVSAVLDIIILRYLFTKRVKSYFGKSSFSLLRLMNLDKEHAKHYFRHAWISGIILGIIFLLAGVQLLLFDSLDMIIWFGLAAVVLGISSSIRTKPSRASGVALFGIFVFGTVYLILTFVENLGSEGFWFMSIELLGIPLFQGMRSISLVKSVGVI
jgi:hypothetical protein